MFSAFLDAGLTSIGLAETEGLACRDKDLTGLMGCSALLINEDLCPRVKLDVVRGFIWLDSAIDVDRGCTNVLNVIVGPKGVARVERFACGPAEQRS